MSTELLSLMKLTPQSTGAITNRLYALNEGDELFVDKVPPI